MASATLLKWKEQAYSDGIMGKANRDGSAMNCSMNMRAREGGRMDESQFLKATSISLPETNSMHIKPAAKNLVVSVALFAFEPVVEYFECLISPHAHAPCALTAGCHKSKTSGPHFALITAFESAPLRED